MNETKPTIAILGTGKMGSAIATRLAAAGFELVLWNRTRSRAEALGLGTVVDTPAAAAREADLVVSSLTGPEAVGCLPRSRRRALGRGGQAFMEMSTAGPDLVAELAAHVRRSAAPSSTPRSSAPRRWSAPERPRSSSVATDADVAVVCPVLAALGTVRHVGRLGSAARLKLVANSMLADVIVAAAELQVAGEGIG